MSAYDVTFTLHVRIDLRVWPAVQKAVREELGRAGHESWERDEGGVLFSRCVHEKRRDLTCDRCRKALRALFHGLGECATHVEAPDGAHLLSVPTRTARDTRDDEKRRAAR